MVLCCSKKTKRNHKADSHKPILINRYRLLPDEIEIYKQKFDRMASGQRLTKEDFSQNMSMTGIKGVISISDRIFNAMLTGTKESVSLEDYLSYMDVLIHGNLQEQVTQSFKIIAGSDQNIITYESFTQWMISVWKIINSLTGQEVLITEDQITEYFEELDLNSDGVIDFEEYSTGISKSKHLLEWFHALNKGMTDRFNVPSVQDTQKEENNYSEKLAGIENEINSLIKIIEIENRTNKPSLSHSDIGVSARNTDRKQSLAVFDIPRQDKDINNPNYCSNLRISKDNLNNYDHKVEIVKKKLIKLLDDLNELKERGAPLESQETELKRTWTNAIPKKNFILKKNDVIYWGDEDWNLVLNMMLGIQKSVKDTAASYNPFSDVTPDMFTQKVKHELSPGQIKGNKTFKFRDFAPTIFERIRKLFGITSNDYIRSLGMEKMMNALMTNEFSSLLGQCTTGKSGSFFYYSDDGKYMLKTLSNDESEFFKKILPDYYYHLYKNPHALITRFFGFHKIISYNSNKQIYFVIMGNLFKSDHDIDTKYDLKGSTLGRVTGDDEDKTIARKDNNFNRENRKIFVGKQRKGYLMQQIEKDCELMRRLNIIDYSLLIGISLVSDKRIPRIANKFVPFNEIDDGGMLSEDKNELYFLGIIDILTNYGTKKKLEHFFKKSIHDKKAVSCAPPDYYAQRFMLYMDTIIE